jgi:hypothetical protein
VLLTVEACVIFAGPLPFTVDSAPTEMTAAGQLLRLPTAVWRSCPPSVSIANNLGHISPRYTAVNAAPWLVPTFISLRFWGDGLDLRARTFVRPTVDVKQVTGDLAVRSSGGFRQKTAGKVKTNGP